MLRRFEIKLDIKEEVKDIYNWGSLFQGLIMENVPSDYAERLHDNNKFNPYSQYVFKDGEEYKWIVSTIDDEAYTNIIENYIFKVKEVCLKQKDLHIDVLNVEMISSIDEEELFKKYFFNTDIKNRINIKLLTPTSYKFDNQYIIIPQVNLILPNLINKWNYFNEKNKIDEDVLEEYINRTYIERYVLRSTKFGIEGLNINSFIGKLTLKINANDTMINLLNMLFEFAEYTGIGIKTSMGMGGVINE